jgi:hypothetical protein
MIRSFANAMSPNLPNVFLHSSVFSRRLLVLHTKFKASIFSSTSLISLSQNFLISLFSERLLNLFSSVFSFTSGRKIGFFRKGGTFVWSCMRSVVEHSILDRKE